MCPLPHVVTVLLCVCQTTMPGQLGNEFLETNAIPQYPFSSLHWLQPVLGEELVVTA